MMASYYQMLRVMSDWLVKKGIKKKDAQKYITSLFLALSEDAVANSDKDLKYLIKDATVVALTNSVNMTKEPIKIVLNIFKSSGRFGSSINIITKTREIVPLNPPQNIPERNGSEMAFINLSRWNSGKMVKNITPRAKVASRINTNTNSM